MYCNYEAASICVTIQIRQEKNTHTPYYDLHYVKNPHTSSLIVQFDEANLF